MNVRILTNLEILNLPQGTQCISVYESEMLNVMKGDTLIRVYKPCDDEHSSAFTNTRTQDYEYLYEGIVGIVESELTEELGIFRPELETRKVGKIRVELVDHGFPLALREIAKVMTWAQTAKGYKDHDWQNLPNAEVALEAAASRHRTDHIEQRVVEGYLIERCVDHESGLLHKAHEAFGVLAQLELMLRGEFDLGVDTPR